ncbi:MAG: dockerin type I domain-containing protein [Planctomycetota bacterium]|nr:dockerin type I domain-containing protein [Planctomycetota bacterium]
MNGHANIMTGLFATALLASAAIADLPQRWTLQVLSHPDAQSLVIQDLNDQGDASGFAFLGFGQPNSHKPFLWIDGQPNILPTTAYWSDGYLLNESGLAVGVDHDNGDIFQYTHDSIEPLGDLGDLFGASMYIEGMNDTDEFCGYRPLGSSRFEAFSWNATEGLVKIAPDSESSRALDINSQGHVVGSLNVSPPLEAYVYMNGQLELLGEGLPGSVQAVAIDDDNRVVLRESIPTDGSTRFHIVDAITGDELYPGPDVPPHGYTFEIQTNEQTHLFLTWIEGDNGDFEGHTGIWTAEDGLVKLVLPEDSIQVLPTSINEHDQVLGMTFTEIYDMTLFVASVDEGIRPIRDRIIGLEPDTFLWPLDLNNSCQIAVRLNGDSYGICGILSPARPGDADGNGSVDVNDALTIIGAWGPWPPANGCGPDLNMDGEVNVNDLLTCLKDWDIP